MHTLSRELLVFAACVLNWGGKVSFGIGEVVMELWNAKLGICILFDLRKSSIFLLIWDVFMFC